MPHVRTLDFDCCYADDCFAEPWTAPSTVLVQAGFGRNGEYWRSWVPGLAREHRVLRRDMRAHGGSSAGAADHEWSPEGLAADVVAFVDALELDRVHYVGESVGGITGIVLGALHPERFASDHARADADPARPAPAGRHARRPPDVERRAARARPGRLGHAPHARR